MGVTAFPERTVTALLGQAVGDAFGSPYEFHPDAPRLAALSLAEGRYLDTRKDCGQPPDRCRTAGLWTDDTQQALILLWVWSKLDERDIEPTAERVRYLFLKVSQRLASEAVPGARSFGLHRGTGKNFRDAVTSGVAPDTAGLGAAMRVGPVATLLSRGDVLPWTVEVSSGTTTNPIALAGSVRLAATAWSAAHEGWHPYNAEELGFQALSPEVQDAWHLLSEAHRDADLVAFASAHTTEVLKGPASGFALTGVPWVLRAVESAADFPDAILRAASLGGDTDTVCAMAGCLAALRFGRESIPAWMLDGLVGREHLEDPTLWHPVRSERAYAEMDRDLQQEVRESLPAGKPKPKRRRT